MELKNFNLGQLSSPLNYTRVKTIEQLDELWAWLKSTEEVGLDIETNFTKEYFTRKIRTIQIGNSEKQFLIDSLDFAGGDGNLLQDCQGEFGKNLYKCPAIQSLAFELAANLNTILKVGVNLGFEYECLLYNFGVRIWHLYSADLVERTIWAGAHSLKDYPFFSMERMMARYFNVQISKDLQASFDLFTPLTPEQEVYAVLDTVFPLAIKRRQFPVIQKDKLEEVVQIENDAIGSFIDMHLHGQRIDRERWAKRIERDKAKLKLVVAELDKYFIPVVGSKSSEFITEEQVAEAERVWKESYGDVRKENRKKHGDLRRKRKEYLDKLNVCEGEAMINYGSPAQIYKVLVTLPGLKTLANTNDDVLKAFDDKPVIKSLQKYREISKLIDTYGVSWITEWRIKCGSKVDKGEGWLWPNDGRLHPKFNQYEAETGRSSSSAPNGQNLPTEDEIRHCFIADPPDEEEPEGYVIVTADMSGAELRFIAELSGAKTWIDAFNRGEDVHSVGTEILYPIEWPRLALPDCKYFKLKPNGEPQRKKCDCPEHKKLRNNNKSTNFLLAYGGGPKKLANEIGVSIKEATEIMELHSKKFPDIWAYLERSGKEAATTRQARDMWGRRRRFPEPTWELAKERAAEFHETERPTDKQILSSMKYMFLDIERQGKNHAIQGSNATAAKLAMGAGFDKNGVGYLWHTLPKYKAKLLAFVHDELVVQCPRRYGEEVAKLIGDAFKRAAADKMTKVTMEFDYHVSDHWQK